MSRFVPESQTSLDEQVRSTGHVTFFYSMLWKESDEDPGEWLPGRYYTGDNPTQLPAGSESFEEGMFGVWFRNEYGIEPTLDRLRLVAGVAGDRAYEADCDDPAPNDDGSNPQGWFTVFYAYRDPQVPDLGFTNPLRFTKHLNREEHGVHSGREAKAWVLRSTDNLAFVAGVCSGYHCNADYGNAKDGDKIWCTIGGEPPQPRAAAPARQHHGLFDSLRRRGDEPHWR